MNVIWYDAETGVVAGQRKVQFTEDEGGNVPTTSEQSVAVDGCKAFVVQNYMGMSTLDDDVFCTTVSDYFFIDFEEGGREGGREGEKESVFTYLLFKLSTSHFLSCFFKPVLLTLPPSLPPSFPPSLPHTTGSLRWHRPQPDPRNLQAALAQQQH